VELQIIHLSLLYQGKRNAARSVNDTR